MIYGRDVKPIVRSIPDHVHLSPNTQNLILQILASRRLAQMAWRFFRRCMTQNDDDNDISLSSSSSSQSLNNGNNDNIDTTTTTTVGVNLSFQTTTATKNDVMNNNIDINHNNDKKSNVGTTMTPLVITPSTFSALLRTLMCASMMKELEESMPYIARLQTTDSELSNIFVALIDGYSSLDRFDQCIAVFRSMKSQWVNSDILNSLIGAFVQNEVKKFYTREGPQFSSIDFSSIESILQLMSSKCDAHVTLPSHVLLSIMKVFERLPYTVQNRETFLQLLRVYVLPFDPSYASAVMIQTYNIYSLWPHECLDDILTADVNPDWNTIISTFLQNQRLTHIRHVLSHMESRKLCPPISMLSSIITYFSHLPQHVSTTLTLLEEFHTKYSFFCTTPLFNSLLESYIDRARSMSEVEAFVSQLLAKHEIEKDWKTNNLLLRAHRKLGSTKSEIEQFMKSEGLKPSTEE